MGAFVESSATQSAGCDTGAPKTAQLDVWRPETRKPGPRGAAVRGLHLVPPAVADAVRVVTGEFACAIAPGGIDEPDRHPSSRERDRVSQVTVVGDHYGCVQCAGEYVDEQVRGDVDVRALLFSAGDGCHEASIGHVLLGPVLHHQRPLRMADNRFAVPARRRKRRRGDARNIIAVADLSHRTGTFQCPQIDPAEAVMSGA